MATSGTTTFNLDLSDIIEEAYELCGLELRSGYEYKTARRALDLLFLEWQNRGLNLFSVEEGTQTLTEGTSSYTLDSDVNKQVDQTLRRISVSEYAHIANKLNKGKPSLFYFDRNISTPAIKLWSSPDGNETYTLVYFYVKKIEDTGNVATNNTAVPTRYLPCMTYGLAYNIACKNNDALQKIPMIKQKYEELWNDVSDADRERASVRFVPFNNHI
jgi:hypothetical protein